VAFGETKKQVCLLEFTRTMDTREEWEERKEMAKTKRYAQILTFINDPSQGGPKWEASQINFTVGARGTIIRAAKIPSLANCQILVSAKSKTGKESEKK
jgi:hypothetical protein